MDKPPTLAQIAASYDQARALAITLLEHRARAVMRSHRNCAEFICCMGSAFFVVKRAGALDGEINVDPCDSYAPAYMGRVAELINEWDDYLKLTGEGFRFTADGPVNRNW